MRRNERPAADDGQKTPALPGPSGLMDLLGVAAVLLQADGRIDMWSPQAEDLFGYCAAEAVGQYAAPLLLHPDHRDLALGLFAEVLHTGRTWAGAFPVRHRDGSARLVEFRNVRLTDSLGDHYALGLAADRRTLRQVERDVALATRLVSQSPIGLAVLDTDLRYVAVNPALTRIHGVPEDGHLGRRFRDVMPPEQFGTAEAGMRGVLESGTPVIDRYTVGRTRADPGHDHAWSVSFFRLEDANGHVLGVANSVVDVTDRHRASAEAERARRRLALIADGSTRIGTTLEVDRTARELADVLVPELADMAGVDILDSVLNDSAPDTGDGAMTFHALAAKAAYPAAARALVPDGRVTTYHPDQPAACCIRIRRPVLMGRLDHAGLARIAAGPGAAALLARAGVHSAMTVPLIARGQVLGVVGLARARDVRPFDEDDQALACELASRAAVCIDNGRLHRRIRGAAETLQRSLLPQLPSRHPHLDLAARYRPALAFNEVGGDWYDVLPLDDHRTALVVGDVMGSGIAAATTMGRLRTATSTLAGLDLDPAQILHHLDRITQSLDPYIATCVFAVHDARTGGCRLATAGHMPPVLARRGRQPELLDLPTGTPLGVGGPPFRATSVHLDPGDLLVLYTDGLVETRSQPIDERLDQLRRLLARPDPTVEETCDRLLHELRHPGDHDDVALLIARVRPRRSDTRADPHHTSRHRPGPSPAAA